MQNKISKITLPFLLLITVCLTIKAQVKTKVFYSEIPTIYKSSLREIPKTYTIKPSEEFFHLKNVKNINEEIQFATKVQTNINFLKEANLEKENDSLKYSISLIAEDALNISLQFSKFKLPKGALLSIYSKNELTDSISSNENNENNIWATRVYQGNRLSIVLKAPSSTNEPIELTIGSVNFGYKNFGVLYDFGNIGASANCNINANCPLGNDWNNEKNSIAMIVVNGQEHCTGSLIMNACNTNTPYILTANHCLSTGNVANWVFQFQTLSTDCATNVGWREDIQFNGCTLRANNAETDFALVQLNTTPLPNSGLVYSGWSRQTLGNLSTTILHHPRGDLMKISQDANPPVIFNDVLTGVQCWFLDLDNGIVEGGSSGAPYYNQNHQIIGQHYRRPQNVGNPRPVPCDMTQTVGGRFDLSWTGGGTNTTRLSNWLDPTNTGLQTINTTNISTLQNAIPNFTLINLTTGLDCNIMEIQATLPLNTTITWTSTNGILINGNPSPYTTTYGNSVTVSTDNGSSGVITATVANGSCNISNNINFCPCIPWSEPNPTIIYAPNFRSEPLIAQVDEHPASAWSYQWYIDGQLISETSTGYLWTNSWPCMGNPRNLEVVAITYCGRSVPINVGEIFLECWGYRQQSTNQNSINLFPNPATNTIFVTLNNEDKHIKASSKLNNISQIAIFDNLGIVRLRKVFANNSKQVQVDISKLNTGIYFLEVFDGKTRQRKQFIKK
jgi:lysyl endopeptidase